MNPGSANPIAQLQDSGDPLLEQVAVATVDAVRAVSHQLVKMLAIIREQERRAKDDAAILAAYGARLECLTVAVARVLDHVDTGATKGAGHVVA